MSPVRAILLTSRSDVSAVFSMDKYKQIGKFFEGFLIPQTQQQALPGSKL